MVAIGTAYIDINCPRFPFDETGFVVETETVGNEYEAVLGGSGLNFCKLCKRLGMSATFVGKIGQDNTGDLLATMLDEADIQSALVVDKKASTNVAVNFINNDGQMIGFVVGTANKMLRPEEVVEASKGVLLKAKYLYISSCFKLKRLLPAFTELVEIAHKAGVTVILDHGRITNGVTKTDLAMVRELAKVADYYMPARDEFLQLWDAETIVEGLELMQSICQGQTIIKDGAGGALSLLDGRVLRVPALEVTPINTIGAGDSFNAGFIAAHHRGLDIEQSMRFGCAAAALKISQEKLPTLAELEVLVTN